MISQEEHRDRVDLICRINENNQKRAEQHYEQEVAHIIVEAWDKISDIIKYTEEDVEPHRANLRQQIAQMNREANAALDAADRARGLL